MFSVAQIIAATGGRVISGRETGRVGGVCIDSRQAKRGQVFVAIKGDIFDGHDFIEEVAALGVRVIVAHRPVLFLDARVTLVLVKDTTRALGDLARAYRSRFKIPVIAVTGSAGKTTTKEMAAAVLARKFRVLKNEGTQNNHIGVPLTLFKLRPAHQMVVLECGTNQPGDIPWLCDVARPTAAVFVNIGESHLKRLGSLPGVLKEKWALTEHLGPGGLLILNADDPLLAKKAAAARRLWKVVTFGIKRRADVQAGDIIVQSATSLRFSVQGKKIELLSCGINNVYNSTAAYAIGAHYGVGHAAMAAALAKFELPQGRGQILRLGKGWLLNDVYNANPVSMRGALQTLEAIVTPGRKIVIAGDMLELGRDARRMHEEIGAAIAAMAVDALITVGPLAAAMAREARRRRKNLVIRRCRDTEEAKMKVGEILRNGDALLVKGSRRMKMETVVDFLLESPRAVLR